MTASPGQTSQRQGRRLPSRSAQRRTALAALPVTSGSLGVERRCFEGLVSVALVGELDLASAPVVEAELLEAGAVADLVVLDLCALSFIDCAGLRALLVADARLRETGGRLVLNNCSRQVRRLLDLAGVSERLELAWAPTALAAEPAAESAARS